MKNLVILTAIAFAFTACDHFGSDDPVFEYNKKSAKVISTNNDFGLELFNQINATEDGENLLISPSSISIAMGMAYNGAETTTKEEFEDLLNYDGLSRQEVNEITLDLINALVTDQKGNTLEIANSIWQHLNFPVYQAFIDMNKTYFDAEVNEEDFSDTKTITKINDWVADKTHDKIKTIIDELSPDARMVLINALYFNCTWKTEFDPEETKTEPFYNESNEKISDVEMMTTESEFNYFSNSDIRAVELPYENDKFSMHLIQPTSGTIDELIESLDGDTWQEWIDGYDLHNKVQVTMPKFKFDYERKLKDDMKALGMTEAFSLSADFSSISEIALFISQIIHKTYIDVNEEGTEAAAVTAIIFETTSIGPNNGPIIVRFDKPFLFAITENTSKSIVFIGKQANPSYEE